MRWESYSFGLSSLLLWSGIRVELEGSGAGGLGALDNVLLSLVGRDLAVCVLGGLDSALLLELVHLADRHLAGWEDIRHLT